MAVTFPLILILFDYYEGTYFVGATPSGCPVGRARGPVLIEKIPFFVLSGIFSITTVLSQKAGGAMNYEKSSHLLQNSILGLRRIGFYISKLLIPIKLSAFYEYPVKFGFASKEFIIAILVIVGLVFYFIKFKKVKREVNFGILFFLISLIPILKVVHIEGALGADRYMYIPMIGFFFAIITTAYSIVTNYKPSLKKVFIAIFAIYLLFLGTTNYARSEVWRNGYNLWSNVLMTSPNSNIATVGLAEVYMTKKDYKMARQYYLRLINHNLFRELALFFIGKICLYEGNINEAKQNFYSLVNEFPNNQFGNNARGYMYLGDISDANDAFQDAVKFYELSLNAAPNDSLVHSNYALTLEKHGKMNEAISHYQLANKLSMNNWDLPQKALSRLNANK